MKQPTDTMETFHPSPPFDREGSSQSFLPYLGPSLFFVTLFFINFLSRIIFSPLMPIIEKDLKIGHDVAGFLFFLVSLGYCVGMFTSGFISYRLRHKNTILLSLFMVGGALLWTGFNRTLWGIGFGLFTLGTAAGFYLPSSIATLAGMVPPRHLGKVISIHELGPGLGYVFAPILTETLMRWCSWQEILMLTGVASLAIGWVFFFWGEKVDFRGEAPNLMTLKSLFQTPFFWVMTAFFSLGVASAIGVYFMIPLYLITEKGMDQTLVNTLLALSRMVTLGTVLFVGWVTDRLGVKKTLKAVFLGSGLVTIMLGVIPGTWIVLAIFLQPILASSFFPVGLVALARAKSPSVKNVVVSLTIPLGYLVGGGGITAGLGLAGESGLFSLGFILFGGILFAGASLTKYLTPDEGEQ